jgi:PhzF family phenazine biosynthesis protein
MAQALRTSSISVFPAAPGGGNPCTIVRDASGMSADDMKAVATAAGHECGFVFPPSDPAKADFRFRFFVPRHEMEMCGHVTLGGAWLIFQDRADAAHLRIETMDGVVEAARQPAGDVEISQRAGVVEPVDAEPVLQALGLTAADLDDGHAIVNASTARAKTLVPLISPDRLHALSPHTEVVRVACEAIGSTGLYPWAPGAPGVLHARQFPRDSGYLEDPATGIAAAALFYGVGAPAAGLIVRQGEAMGRPSEIHVRRDPAGTGCRLSGAVALIEDAHRRAGLL